jgi:hypothetical protein
MDRTERAIRVRKFFADYRYWRGRGFGIIESFKNAMHTF